MTERLAQRLALWGAVAALLAFVFYIVRGWGSDGFEPLPALGLVLMASAVSGIAALLRIQTARSQTMARLLSAIAARVEVSPTRQDLAAFTLGAGRVPEPGDDKLSPPQGGAGTARAVAGIRPKERP